jgi:hypothetical protein
MLGDLLDETTTARADAYAVVFLTARSATTTAASPTRASTSSRCPVCRRFQRIG